MFSVIYDFALLLVGLIALPQLFWQWLKYGKYRESLDKRIGWQLPPEVTKKPVIWIHVVSVGETRAVLPLYKKMRAEKPEATFVITSVTETGHAEAKRSLVGAEHYLFLPLDFSFIMKRFVQCLKPDLLILVEGEFWYHLLKYVKRAGAKVLLVNGKLSERSFQRFQWGKFFARRLFALIDDFCLQSTRYMERFQQLGIANEKLRVTGNLKLDAAPALLTAAEKANFREELGIVSADRVLVVGSSHEGEETLLLDALAPVWEKIPTLKVLIVPRHPERFPRVAELIKQRGLSMVSYTERQQKKGDERVILIDTMGLLMRCFQLAEVAIVAGSFVPGIGGHNIFEPVLLGVPVLFGPHMQTQLDLVDLVTKSGAGFQVSNDLPKNILELLSNSKHWEKIHQNCLSVAAESKGSTDRTWVVINSLKAIC